MKRFLSAGEGYAQKSRAYKLISPFTRYKFGWLAYPSWGPKVTGIQVLVALLKSSALCNFSFLRTSCIYLGLFFMCLQAAIANQPDPVTDRAVLVAKNPTKYQIGDKLPKDFVIGYDPFDSLKTIKLSDFKGKAVILDAWATWCGACISKFPMMDSLQRQHPERLQIMLVNVQGIDTPERVRKFLSDYIEKNPDFELDVVIESVPLNTFFEFRYIPHYIWIDKNRRIRAFTDAKDITDPNLQRLFAGQSIYIPMKLN